MASLSKRNKERLEDGKYSDVTIIVQGKKINAHRMTLANQSDYFDKLFYGSLANKAAEIELKEIPVRAFEHLLEYIYTGCLSLEDKIVEPGETLW